MSRAAVFSLGLIVGVLVYPGGQIIGSLLGYRHLIYPE